MVVAWAVVAYLVLAEPVLGLALYRRLGRGAVSRRTVYIWSIVQGWALALASVGALVLGGVAPSALGIGLGSLLGPAGQGGTALGLVAGIAGGALGGVVLGALIRRARAAARAQAPEPGRVGDFDRLLPRTPGERALFVAVALTAGICEEVLYRAVVLHVLRQGLPILALPAAVALSAVIFALGHLDQGWPGVIATAVLGALLGAIYVASGSLILPVAIHLLIDMRALLAPRLPPGATSQPTAA